MANELVHGSVGTSMTQSEFEAVGLHVCNSQATGDLIYASSATQLSRLAIGAADTVLTCNGTIPAWSATPILNTAVAKGTWTASGTWTIPAITLNGAVTGGSQEISSLGNMSFVASREIDVTVDNSFLSIRGGTRAAGTGCWVVFGGKTYGSVGVFQVYTPNAALTADVVRLSISGGLATAVATWTNITHTGLVLSDHLTLHITDTDGATEGDIWYDASENKLKFFNGVAVETITSAA